MKNKAEFVRVIKFALLSASAGIIQSVTFTLIDTLFHPSYYASYLPALILSVLWNFTLNRKFTFKSANNVPIAMLKVFGYYLVFTPLSTWLGNVASVQFADVRFINYIVLVVTMIANLVTEFLFQRYFVFGKSIDTNVKKKD
ncbi:MAG: GtrA family protein [Clostridia bacterium]|nr:GtrA family protein [Clostridia bacterium]